MQQKNIEQMYLSALELRRQEAAKEVNALRQDVARAEESLKQATAAVEAAKSGQLAVVEKITALLQKGWRCDFGHTTSSSTHEEWQSDNGETGAYVVVPSGTPKVIHATEWSDGYTIKVDGPEGFNAYDPNAGLGDGYTHFLVARVFYTGATEIEAWEHALEEVE